MYKFGVIPGYSKRDWSMVKENNVLTITNEKDSDLRIEIWDKMDKCNRDSEAVYVYADVLKKYIKRVKILLDGERKNLRNIFFRVGENSTEMFITNAYVAYRKVDSYKIFSGVGDYFVSVYGVQLIEQMSPLQKVYFWKSDDYFFMSGSNWRIRTDAYRCPKLEDVTPKGEAMGYFTIKKNDSPLDVKINFHGTQEKTVSAYKYRVGDEDVFINPYNLLSLFKIVDTYQYDVAYFGKQRPLICVPLVTNPSAYKVLMMPMYMGG